MKEEKEEEYQKRNRYNLCERRAWEETKRKLKIAKIEEAERKRIKRIQDIEVRKGIEYRLWRESVLARDNWTCQKYFIKGKELHTHHIVNFSQCPELRTSIENGITLSKKAHKEFHRKYGRRSNTREQMVEFLNN